METQIRNKIIVTLQNFDLFQLLEVLNFVEYLGNKKKGARKKTPHLDLLMAKYNDMFSRAERSAIAVNFASGGPKPFQEKVSGLPKAFDKDNKNL